MKNLTTNTLRSLLNNSAAKMDDETTEKLRCARSRALESHRTLQNTPILAWLSQHGVRALGGQKIRSWMASLILLATLLASFFYLQQIREHEHSEIDLAILVDDLPVEAYVEQ